MKTYDELLAERDTLAAQVEALRDAAADAANALGFLSHHLSGRVGEAALLDMAEKADAVSEALSETPQQCLADIKAEAGRAGFIACAEWVGDSEYENDKMLKAADEYAAKIRNTGTWLKDSNVNSGKRQGGAE